MHEQFARGFDPFARRAVQSEHHAGQRLRVLDGNGAGGGGIGGSRRRHHDWALGRLVLFVAPLDEIGNFGLQNVHSVDLVDRVTNNSTARAGKGETRL